jgi:hypothetical protein
MSKRRVHLRTARVISLGSSKTYCGRVIDWAPMDTSGAVIDFGDFEATVHGTLVTCERCLPGTYTPDSALPKSARKAYNSRLGVRR